MRDTDSLHERRTGLTAVRWVLIAISAVLILFTENLTGRLGFAALLLLAIFLGRYASSRGSRLSGATRPAEPIDEQSAPERRRSSGDL